VRPYNFGASGSILTKLFQTTCRRAGVIMWVQLLEGPPPKFWECQKTVQISARFLTTFDFDREYLRKGSTYRKSEKNSFNHNHFRVERNKLAELWSTNNRDPVVHINPPKWIFFPETTFWPSRGAAPSNFYTCKRLTQATQRTPIGEGGPPKKILMAKT